MFNFFASDDNSLIVFLWSWVRSSMILNPLYFSIPFSDVRLTRIISSSSSFDTPRSKGLVLPSVLVPILDTHLIENWTWRSTTRSVLHFFMSDTSSPIPWICWSWAHDLCTISGEIWKTWNFCWFRCYFSISRAPKTRPIYLTSDLILIKFLEENLTRFLIIVLLFIPCTNSSRHFNFSTFSFHPLTTFSIYFLYYVPVTPTAMQIIFHTKAILYLARQTKLTHPSN